MLSSTWRLLRCVAPVRECRGSCADGGRRERRRARARTGRRGRGGDAALREEQWFEAREEVGPRWSRGRGAEVGGRKTRGPPQIQPPRRRHRRYRQSQQRHRSLYAGLKPSRGPHRARISLWRILYARCFRAKRRARRMLLGRTRRERGGEFPSRRRESNVLLVPLGPVPVPPGFSEGMGRPPPPPARPLSPPWHPEEEGTTGGGKRDLRPGGARGGVSLFLRAPHIHRRSGRGREGRRGFFCPGVSGA